MREYTYFFVTSYLVKHKATKNLIHFLMVKQNLGKFSMCLLKTNAVNLIQLSPIFIYKDILKDSIVGDVL